MAAAVGGVEGGIRCAKKLTSTLLRRYGTRSPKPTLFRTNFASGADGHRGWAWLYGAGIPLVFAALMAVGFAIGINPAAPAFLATPWVWVTALAVHLY